MSNGWVQFFPFIFSTVMCVVFQGLQEILTVLNTWVSLQRETKLCIDSMVTPVVSMETNQLGGILKMTATQWSRRSSSWL